jgi:hypothetical protein
MNLLWRMGSGLRSRHKLLFHVSRNGWGVPPSDGDRVLRLSFVAP